MEGIGNQTARNMQLFSQGGAAAVQSNQSLLSSQGDVFSLQTFKVQAVTQAPQSYGTKLDISIEEFLWNDNARRMVNAAITWTQDLSFKAEQATISGEQASTFGGLRLGKEGLKAAIEQHHSFSMPQKERLIKELSKNSDLNDLLLEALDQLYHKSSDIPADLNLQLLFEKLLTIAEHVDRNYHQYSKQPSQNNGFSFCLPRMECFTEVIDGDQTEFVHGHETIETNYKVTEVIREQSDRIAEELGANKGAQQKAFLKEACAALLLTLEGICQDKTNTSFECPFGMMQAGDTYNDDELIGSESFLTASPSKRAKNL